MDLNISTILKGCGMALAATICVVSYREISKRQKELNVFKKYDLRDLSSLQSMKQGEEVYVKAKLQNTKQNKSNVVLQRRPIHYNEFYLEEPSDVVVINKLHNSQIFSPIYENKVWSFVDRNDRKVNFYGINFIVGDVYNVERKLQKFENGILKRAWGGLCYYIECIFDAVRKSKYKDSYNPHVPVTREPVIKGPVIGILHYSVGLIIDAYFVLKVRFQNGFHQAVILAESRSSLLGYYETQVMEAKIGTFVGGAIAALLAYFVYKDLQKLATIQGVIQRIEAGNKKWLEVENVDQQKACIICYANCRNLILFDCKHLIMCWSCWKTMKHEDCPICKKRITTAKIVYSDDQKKKGVRIGGKPMMAQLQQSD